jgi:putative endonuclease
MHSHNYFVYILTNPKRTTIYIGVTNDLKRRLEEHVLNAGDPATFAGKFYCHILLYYERFTFVDHAIQREKELKKWSRSKKETLINSMNPHWFSLNSDIQED